jgi:Ca2+-binding RTX toxin-like protein
MAVIAISLSVVPGAHAARSCLGKRATIVGTTRGDILRGTAGADVIVGLGGSDQIDGRGGNDRICSGKGVDDIDGGAGADRVDAAGGLDFVVGGGGDDDIDLGGGFVNFVDGGGGDDRMAGAGPLDFVAYDRAPAAMTIDLATGSATGHGTDTLIGIDGAVGSVFDDTITGNDGTNFLLGHDGNDTISSGGNAGDIDSPASLGGELDILQGDVGFEPTAQVGDDTLIGGAGFNVAVYAGSATGVQVDLLLGTASGQGNDDLTDIQGVVGTEYDDTLTGDLDANAFEGEGGNDEIDGRAGQDVAMFTGASEVTADLATGTATSVHPSGPSTIALTDIEDLWGSQGPDTLSGNANPNELYGNRGRDTIAGAAGDDLLDGQAGNDNLDGGDGTDTCQNGETVVNCEAPRRAATDLDLGISHRPIARAVRAWWSVYARR